MRRFFYKLANGIVHVLRFLLPLLIVGASVFVVIVSVLIIASYRKLGIDEAYLVVVTDLKNIVFGDPIARPDITAPVLQSLILLISILLLTRPIILTLSENYGGGSKPELTIRKPGFFEDITSTTDKILGQYFKQADHIVVFGGDYSYLGAKRKKEDETLGEIISALCEQRKNVVLFTNRSLSDVRSALAETKLTPDQQKKISERVIDKFDYDFKASFVRIQSHRHFIYIDRRGPEKESSLVILSDEKHSRPILDFIELMTDELSRKNNNPHI